MDDPFGQLMNFLNCPAGSGPAEKPAGEPFELTDVQHAYLVGRHRGLELGGVAAHSYFEFDCPELDVPRLTAALRKVVDRHDMLRAVIDDGRQRVLGRVPAYDIEVTDLRGRCYAEQTAALEQVRAELVAEVRPVDQWPPFDVRATLLAPDQVRLHLSVDLMFIDVRGLFLMLNEWRNHYDDASCAPAPLTTSFRDHVAAQRAQDTSREERYWLSRVDDLPPAPDLPLATPPERLGTPSFHRLSTTVDKEHWAALTAAAKGRGLSPNAVLLTAYCEVLRTWSKRPDFTVTVTSLDPRAEDVIGDFLSLTLFAAHDNTAETFEDRVAAVQSRLRDDLDHSAFGGIEVLRELARRRGDGRGVSMPVVYSSVLGSELNANALRVFGELVRTESQTPQIWLENQVVEADCGLTVNWNSVDGLFPDGVLDAMFAEYRAVLDRLVDDEDAWELTGSLVRLPDADAAERREANATAKDLPKVRLHDLVARAAARTPDAVAVIADDVEVTYRQLTEDAHRLARGLDGEPNTLVAVSMRPGAQLYSALLGVLHSGSAYVSIDPDLPEQRRLALLKRCAAKAVITEPALRDELTWPDDIAVVTLDDVAHLSAEPLRSSQTEDDLAYVIFTSGSTGEPKGVMIAHHAAGNTVQDINERFGVGPTDRVLALAPTGFDLSVYDVFGVLGAGGTVVVPSPGRVNDVDHWTELVARHGVTIWNSVPAPMRLWVESLGDDAPDTVRLALLSGDWIPTSLPGQIHARFPEMDVISLGGATECSIWSVFFPIGEVPPEWPSIPYGKPLWNQTLHVLNDRLDPCPAWVTGEIYIGGTGVALGYWADEQRTAERFVDVGGERLYKTGDLGRYLPGGDIEILGRTDFQVKINGYRVELGEIEAALDRQPGVRQALVAAPAHPQTGHRQLAAYLVLDDEVDTTLVRKALAEVLPSYMVPNHYVTIDALPLTTNGKINHGALPAPWSDGGEDEERVSPRSDVEERLLRIWAAQLGHGDLGVEDGFFDIGGDSLHAVGILSHLRAEFGLDSTAEQQVIEGLFMNATIAEFADVVRSAAGS
ncbi:amino acid adenylation domain-containing protein [Lentzea tibetensis]|uniref:Phenyloxazoline synthase MbtB n=1 Tax=Lentzea tibetensis TaxID=2591470 RepID=A0A563ESV3_9PSEU|nr:non-ribosomal peptide synthetase [Lentzea tibetensis]TWP50746.1 amino acid adenylation domain-containing protein [Lentzea tibetensis]